MTDGGIAPVANKLRGALMALEEEYDEKTVFEALDRVYDDYDQVFYEPDEFGDDPDAPFLVIDECGESVNNVVYDDKDDAIDARVRNEDESNHPVFPIVVGVGDYEELTGKEVL
jgi:hypothetical protein